VIAGQIVLDLLGFAKNDSAFVAKPTKAVHVLTVIICDLQNFGIRKAVDRVHVFCQILFHQGRIQLGWQESSIVPPSSQSL